MAFTPVLIVIVICGLAIVALRKWADFARSEIERLRNLERYSDVFFRNIAPVINANGTPIEILTIAKAIGQDIDRSRHARDIYRIHTGELSAPANPYAEVFEKFRKSHPELSGYLDEALHGARLAYTYASRKWGPQARECLDKVREQVKIGTTKVTNENLPELVVNNVLEVTRIVPRRSRARSTRKAEAMLY